MSASRPKAVYETVRTCSRVVKNAREHLRQDLLVVKNGNSQKRLASSRIWYAVAGGEDRPSPNGYAIDIEQLPALIAALQKAHADAVELGWLPVKSAEAAE